MNLILEKSNYFFENKLEMFKNMSLKQVAKQCSKMNCLELRKESINVGLQ